MSDAQKIARLEAEIAALKQEHATLERERNIAVGAINQYRLSLILVDRFAPADLSPIAKASIASNLKSHLNGPLVAQVRELAAAAGEIDSFAVSTVSAEQMWDRFIDFYARKYGFVVKEKGKPVKDGPITMKNFLGSIDHYKTVFLESQK